MDEQVLSTLEIPLPAKIYPAASLLLLFVSL